MEEAPRNPDDTGRPVQLAGRQRAVFDALSEKNDRLSGLYFGAIVALATTGNPDKHAQACHSLRELMENIPKWIDAIPTPKKPPSMGVKVREFANSWKKTQTLSKCSQDGAWSGHIDEPLSKALKQANDLVAWVEEQFPHRKKLAAAMLQGLDPLGLPLPQQIEDVRIDDWFKCLEYLNAVAHHNKLALEEDINGRLYFLENFLLELLRPKTFQKHKMIDDVIARGEGIANS